MLRVFAKTSHFPILRCWHGGRTSSCPPDFRRELASALITRGLARKQVRVCLAIDHEIETECQINPVCKASRRFHIGADISRKSTGTSLELHVLAFDTIASHVGCNTDRLPTADRRELNSCAPLFLNRWNLQLSLDYFSLTI